MKLLRLSGIDTGKPGVDWFLPGILPLFNGIVGIGIKWVLNYTNCTLPNVSLKM